MINVKNISKKYTLGKQGFNSTSLRETFANLSFESLKRRPKSIEKEFYALKDVSFNIGRGETVGLIGRNGAGKTTLLKILSQITFPTSGHAELFGRVGSLLEVGAGFNYDLTGRENVFLNGAILGMPHRETSRKFDDIIAFANLEKFVDVQVKHYSSGMFMRLAFAVAAHVEPEILLLDEVLAVGDFEFQQRCAEKIEQLARSGHTILLVSHDLSRIEKHCRRAIWIEDGRLKMDDKSEKVTKALVESAADYSACIEWEEKQVKYGSPFVRLRRIQIVGEDRQPIKQIDLTKRFGVEIKFDVLTDEHLIVPRLDFTDGLNTLIFCAFEVDSEWHHKNRQRGQHTCTAWLPANLFGDGRLGIGVSIFSFRPWTIHFEAPNLLLVDVVSGSAKLTARGHFEGNIPGLIRPLLNWTSEYDK
jgi:lipopolysaccharide transport system ATP-binding protein